MAEIAELVGELRKSIDRYDLSINPVNNRKFWEFEPTSPFPDPQAITSMIHVGTHINRMRVRILEGKWDMSDEVLPEILCTVRRLERSLGLNAAYEVIQYHVGTTGVLHHADMFDLIALATSEPDVLVHDAMHSRLDDPSADVQSGSSPLKCELGLAELWAIGIDLASMLAVEPVATTRARLGALAIRFSDGLFMLDYTDG